jgi:hypothetical protein
MSTAPRRILIVNGHPDAGARHLLHQLVDAYAEGALAAGHAAPGHRPCGPWQLAKIR